MRTSAYAILGYAAMIGAPLLMLLIVIGLYMSFAYAYVVGPVLLALALIVYGAYGISEAFVHRKYPGSGKMLGRGKSEEHNLSEKGGSGTEISIALSRFNNSTSALDSDTYKIRAGRLTTVLDAILDIKAYQDNTISVRCNCRMGICGSCGMVVNGKPVLACETNLLKSVEDGKVEVGPMQGHPLTKDLVTDFGDFFEKHKSVEPTLYREDVKEKNNADKEYRQSKEEVDKFLPYSYCIMCGLCLDACPVVNSNPNFVGPQALSQTYRYSADSRDQKGKKRLFDIDSKEGAWGCEFSGSCSKACPKGVDPASAIQLLKGSLMKNVADKE